MINSWKNAGTPWWRKKWEATMGHVHVYAWTEARARRKALRVHTQLVTKRVGKGKA